MIQKDKKQQLTDLTKQYVTLAQQMRRMLNHIEDTLIDLDNSFKKPEFVGGEKSEGIPCSLRAKWAQEELHRS